MRVIWRYLKIILTEKSISHSFSIHLLSLFFGMRVSELLTFCKIIWHKETYLSSSSALVMLSKDYFCPDFVAFVTLWLKWADSSFLRFKWFDLKTSLQSQLSQTSRSAARWSSEGPVVRLENKNRTAIQNTKLYRSGYFRNLPTILFVIS